MEIKARKDYNKKVFMHAYDVRYTQPEQSRFDKSSLSNYKKNKLIREFVMKRYRAFFKAGWSIVSLKRVYQKPHLILKLQADKNNVFEVLFVEYTVSQ